MSRIEKILKAIINGESVTMTPKSRNEALLLEIMQTGGGGSGGGGSGGGNILILSAPDETSAESGENITANMTLSEAIEAINNHKIVNVFLFFPSSLAGGLPIYSSMDNWCDASPAFGTECIFVFNTGGLTLFWTADGFTTEPPEG